MTGIDPIALLIVAVGLSLMPMIVVLTTSFVKLSVVMVLLRNALGLQQAPPNTAMYGLAMILSVYIMAPVFTQSFKNLTPVVVALEQPGPVADRLPAIGEALHEGVQPLRAFMLRIGKPENREFFLKTAHRLWGEEAAKDARQEDLIIVVPAFLVSELTSAFQIGFLLFLPFVIIDLIVSNVLLAMGMMMVSPMTISLPLKLFLFVMVDGWTRLLQSLVLTYT
ncbi:type III secretion system export apparatus subunit SctR [Achromobacter aloeverae]|uniref:EscR/YscR/HrcR family type III secretion system export apparatus protein n=1 Tax=Achromobacter aloeverae TaxID=1750518 RepID=A0A4Q1HJJ8_9BURK|nr:type III secretion system export apparatus subunit SctR [Achromobacter aloeverae]RXN87786.1 EscR/YscR/HrcR family type III secretion system export apparatus protein [Achromobacter aloeverae]